MVKFECIMLQKLILQEIQLLPEFAQMEVFNFLLFVKSKYIEIPPVQKEKGKRPRFGCGSVKITMTKDFDAPLEDFKDYM
ncbi:MAG: DUF2281 domain-containing protein [Bacteroidia bacterium]|nr:DUF2281 domain-containing protein [Bacteroidia bacterium]